MWWSAWPSSSGLNVNFSHEKFKIFNESRPDLKCKVLFAYLGNRHSLKMLVLYSICCFETALQHKFVLQKEKGGGETCRKINIQIILFLYSNNSKKMLKFDPLKNNHSVFAHTEGEKVIC